MFTSFDLSVIPNAVAYKYAANITAFQIFEPSVNKYFAELNSIRKSNGKPKLQYKPVKYFFYFLNVTETNTFKKQLMIITSDALKK